MRPLSGVRSADMQCPRGSDICLDVQRETYSTTYASSARPPSIPPNRAAVEANVFPLLAPLCRLRYDPTGER